MELDIFVDSNWKFLFGSFSPGVFLFLGRRCVCSTAGSASGPCRHALPAGVKKSLFSLLKNWGVVSLSFELRFQRVDVIRVIAENPFSFLLLVFLFTPRAGALKRFKKLIRKQKCPGKHLNLFRWFSRTLSWIWDSNPQSVAFLSS